MPQEDLSVPCWTLQPFSLFASLNQSRFVTGERSDCWTVLVFEHQWAMHEPQVGGCPRCLKPLFSLLIQGGCHGGLLPFPLYIPSPESRSSSTGFGVSAGTAHDTAHSRNSKLFQPCSISLLFPFLALLGLPTCLHRAMAIHPVDSSESGLLFFGRTIICA